MAYCRGVYRSKPGPDRLESIGLKDRNFECAKTEDRTGSIRSGPGLTRFPLDLVRV